MISPTIPPTPRPALRATFVGLAALIAAVAVPTAGATQPIGEELRLSPAVSAEGESANYSPYVDVARDPVNDTFLVVWTDGPSAAASELYGRLLNADGVPLGGAVQLTQMGDTTTDVFDAHAPAVAYNPVSREFVVIYHADDNTGGLVAEDDEIFGIRLDSRPKSVVPVGPDFRISFTGPDGSETGDGTFQAGKPSIAVDERNGNMAVVWRADDDPDANFEVFGRLLAPDGAFLTDQVAVSEMGGPANAAGIAGDPEIVWNPRTEEFLTAWDGKEANSTAIAREVWVQRLSPALSLVSGPQRAISKNPANRSTSRVSLAVNTLTGGYLVTWHSNGDRADRREVRAAALDRSAVPQTVDLGALVSQMTPDATRAGVQPQAEQSHVIFRPDKNEYLVIWRGERPPKSNGDAETEVFGRRLSASGLPVGEQHQVSSAGRDGDTARGISETLALAAGDPARAGGGRVQMVWMADDPTLEGQVADNQWEVFGRQWGPAPATGGGGGGGTNQEGTTRDLNIGGGGITGGGTGGGGGITSIAPPGVETGPTTGDKTPTSFTVSGFVTPSSGLPTRYYVEYGVRHTLDQRSEEATLAAPSGRQPVTVTLHDLTPGRTYYYRLIAQNDAGRVEGTEFNAKTPAPSLFSPGVTATTRCYRTAQRTTIGCGLIRINMRAQLRNPNTNRPAAVDARAKMRLRVICRRLCTLDQTLALAEGEQVVPTVSGPARRFRSPFRVERGPAANKARVSVRQRGSLFTTSLHQVFTNGMGKPYLFPVGAEVHVIASGEGARPGLVRIRFKDGSVTRESCRAIGTRPVGCRLQ